MPKYAALLFLVILSATLHARDDDPEPKPKAVKPRAIIKFGPVLSARGSYDKPTRVTTQKQLLDVVGKENAGGAIMKAVDFRKEHLLLFCWSGSRGDLLEPADGKAGEANFTFTPGKEKNNALHVGTYAVPAKAKVKVTLAR
jgi:hypothetical protein